MDYKNGKVYCLRSHQTDDVYIGSTCTPLHKRLYYHRSDYTRWKDDKYHYVTSFKILEYDDAYIELLEDYPCERKEQLYKREKELIREMDRVNKRIECLSKRDWREYFSNIVSNR